MPARMLVPVVAALVSLSLAAAEGQHQIVTVQARKVGASTVLGGTVLPFKEVTLTAQVPGRVVLLAGEEGDWFKSGEILVSLDRDELWASGHRLWPSCTTPRPLGVGPGLRFGGSITQATSPWRGMESAQKLRRVHAAFQRHVRR